MTRCVAFSIVCLLAASQAEAQTKPEDMGTPQQRAACSHDVGRFCKSVRPEEGPFAYLACLQQNRDKLRPACQRVIEGGQP
jgi:hypothetical protein